MKYRIRKVSIIVLTVLLLLSQGTLSVFAANEQQITFSGKEVSAKRGDTIKLPITIASDKAIELGGLALTIQYKTDCLAYKDGSFEMTVVDGMSDCVVYDNTKEGKVTLAWTSTDVIKLGKSKVLFTPSFEVLDTALEDSGVVLEITEAYTYTGNKIKEFDIKQKQVPISITVGTDSSVDKVVELINNIGTVAYTQESLDKIMAAASAYSILTESQKKQVENYNVLAEAMVEYERLRIEAEETKVSDEISAFMENHKYALALEMDTVAVSDEEAVTAAIEAYGNLSAEAKSRSDVYKYKRKLDKLLAQIEVLKKEAADKEAAEKLEAEQRKQAVEYAETFKKDYEYFLNLKADQLVAEHYTGLDAAMTQLNILIGINSYVEEYLKAEKIILTGLFDTVQDIMKNGDSEESTPQMEADSFRSNFAYVLSLTPETVTADDALDVMLAEALYDMLDPEIQGLLTEEYTLIGELLTAIDNLPAEDEWEGDEDSDGSEEVNQTTQTNVTVYKGLDNLIMRFANRKIGVIVLILFLLLILSTIIFITLQLFYRLYFKKGRKLKKGDRR